MSGGIRLGRLFGIEISIHPSWFIILALFAFTLANGFFPDTYRDWSQATAWIVAIIATVLLFVTVLAHELGHSLVAKSQGIEVKSITLFLLGGVASIEKEAATPGREALMAGVGPLVSIVIGVVCSVLAQVLPGPEYVVAVLFYLGIANLSLAVFNLLPGFPLDGGRVLRALLWWRNHSFERATRQATFVGQAFGVALVGLALVQLVTTGELIISIWTALVGWVLIQAARASARQAVLQHELAGMPVSSIMTRPSEWVSPYVTLSHAAQGHFTDFDSRCLPVAPESEDQPYDGLVCGADLARMPRENWETSRVRDAMVPAEKVPVVAPETPADEALRLLSHDEVDRLAVIDRNGQLVGFVDDTAIARFAMLRRSRDEARLHEAQRALD